MSPKPLPLRVAASLGAMGLVAVASVAVGSASDTSAATLLVLALEPLLWGFLLLGSAYALLRRRPLLAAVALFGVVSLAWGLRRDPPRVEPPHVNEQASPWMRRCAYEAAQASRPLRLLSWTAEGEVGALRELVEVAEPDVVVVQGMAEAEAESLARVLEADLAWAESGSGGQAVLAMQGLHECGPERVYSVSLPALGEREAGAMLSFPLVDGQAVPLLALDADGPSALELGQWPDLLEATGLTLAGVGRGLSSEALLVVGDAHTHTTFRQFEAHMASAGLAAAPARPTWPARLGPLPVPPLYSPERLWHGASWQVQAVETRRTQGPNLALVVDLAPSGA